MEGNEVGQSHHLPVGIGEVDGHDFLLGQYNEGLGRLDNLGLLVLLVIVLGGLLLWQDREEVDDLRGEVENHVLLVLALPLHGYGVTVPVHLALHATREENELVIAEKSL